MTEQEKIEVWRNQFEKIYDNGVNVDRHIEGDYVRDATEYLWQGFLMAKRTMPVIELPDQDNYFDRYDENSCDYASSIKTAITAAGYQYKIKGE